MRLIDGVKSLFVLCGVAALGACNPLLTDPVSQGGEFETTSARYVGPPAAWLEVAVSGAGDDTVYALAVLHVNDGQDPSLHDCAGPGDTIVDCIRYGMDVGMPNQRVVPGDGSAFVRMITLESGETVEVILVCVDPTTQNLGCPAAVRAALRTEGQEGVLVGV
jgi:hypothetical protein